MVPTEGVGGHAVLNGPGPRATLLLLCEIPWVLRCPAQSRAYVTLSSASCLGVMPSYSAGSHSLPPLCEWFLKCLQFLEDGWW